MPSRSPLFRIQKKHESRNGSSLNFESSSPFAMLMPATVDISEISILISADPSRTDKLNFRHGCRCRNIFFLIPSHLMLLRTAWFPRNICQWVVIANTRLLSCVRRSHSNIQERENDYISFARFFIWRRPFLSSSTLILSSALSFYALQNWLLTTAVAQVRPSVVEDVRANDGIQSKWRWQKNVIEIATSAFDA